MTREWKPGAVGINEVGERFIVSSRGECFWSGVDKGDWSGLSGEPTESDRPLVVIDPEDRDQVERLASDFMAHDDPLMDPTRSMQAALREFANPKPWIVEPKGEWAVVMDADGNVWTRMNDVHWSSEASPNNRQTWGEIDVVRVLSEGVQS